MAIAVHIPNQLGWGSTHFSKILFVCTIDTESFSYKIFYACICLMSIVISFVFYSKIYLILRGTTLAKSLVTKQNINRKGNGKQSCLEDEIKMIKATFKIFVLFFVCWSPVTVLLFADLGDAVPLWAYLYSGLLAHANSTLNFFVYYLQNDNFTNSFKEFLHGSRRSLTSNFKILGDTFNNFGRVRLVRVVHHTVERIVLRSMAIVFAPVLWLSSFHPMMVAVAVTTHTFMVVTARTVMIAIAHIVLVASWTRRHLG
uniref:G-protein coupled receptors family 1 profile domain-containing protein n=1 Tax=Romanomermis culicivorax TaxID=13658 RepID=A0A915HHD4_ROMCU